MSETDHPVAPHAEGGYSDEPRFRPFADPCGPGWGALAVSLFTFSFFSAAIGMPFDDPNVSILASTALLVGGLVVFISGMWAFATNDTIHASLFTLIGSLFGSVGMLSIVGFNVYNTVGQDKTISHAAGTFWLAWMFVVFALFIGTVRYRLMTSVFMFLLFLSFVILAGGTWVGRRTAIKAGGWFSFFASLVALFNCFEVIYHAGYSPITNMSKVSEKFSRKSRRNNQQDAAAANV